MRSAWVFGILVLALSSPLSFLQKSNAQLAGKIVSLPKPAVGLTPGTFKYKATDLPAVDGAVHSSFFVTIKDDGGVWTVTSAWEFPEGPVTDVLTLEKGTLVLRKESFKHFLHPEQPWKPIAVSLDLTENKVTGTTSYVGGQEKPVSAGLSGPLFAAAAIDITVGCLPMADGYATTFRYFDVERLALNPQSPDREKLLQMKVVGTERVVVPAGTFDTYRVELTSADGSYKETVWIAKDSRTPVKTYVVEVWTKGTRKSTSSMTTELVMPRNSPV